VSTFSTQIRIEILKMLKKRGFGHLGGSMSIVETLSVLYRDIMNIDPKNPSWEERDYLVLSKGHAGPALYSTLALKGYFDVSELATLNNNGTNLPSHCDRLLTTGIDMTTGSLGQGISSAVGIAKAIKIENKTNRVFAIVGDGELNEGQCYEALMFARHHELDNFILFIDENKLQLDGYTDEIVNQGSIERKIESFGFQTVRIDGHSEDAIKQAILNTENYPKQPHAIVLDTIKAKGVPFFENNKGNHHIRFSNEDNLLIDKLIKNLEEEIK
jgi:transketolase